MDFHLPYIEIILLGTPLVKDEIETLDPKLNPVYQNATASLFLHIKMVRWLEGLQQSSTGLS